MQENGPHDLHLHNECLIRLGKLTPHETWTQDGSGTRQTRKAGARTGENRQVSEREGVELKDTLEHFKVKIAAAYD